MRMKRTPYQGTCGKQQWDLTQDSKVHGANMGPTWVLSAPDWPHVVPTNLVIRDPTPIDCTGYGMIIQPIQGFPFHPSSHLAYPEQVLSLLCCNCNSLGVYATCWYCWRKWNHLCFEMQQCLLCAMCQRGHSTNVYWMWLTAKMKPTWCQMMVMMVILNCKSQQSFNKFLSYQII